MTSGFSTPFCLDLPGGVLFITLSFETYVIYEFLECNDYNERPISFKATLVSLSMSIVYLPFLLATAFIKFKILKYFYSNGRPSFRSFVCSSPGQKPVNSLTLSKTVNSGRPCRYLMMNNS